MPTPSKAKPQAYRQSYKGFTKTPSSLGNPAPRLDLSTPPQPAPWLDELAYTLLTSYITHVESFGHVTTFGKYEMHKPITLHDGNQQRTVNAKLTWRWYIKGKDIPYVSRWEFKFDKRSIAEGHGSIMRDWYVIGKDQPIPITGQVFYRNPTWVDPFTGAQTSILDAPSNYDLTSAYQNPAFCVLAWYHCDVLARSTLGDYDGSTNRP